MSNIQPEKINTLFGGASSLTDLFKKAKSQITDLPMAMLGKIQSVNTAFSTDTKYGVATVQPIPAVAQDGTFTIEGYFFSDEFAAGDLVLVIFTDADFRTAIKTYDSAQFIMSTNKTKHSEAFGVLIKLQ